MSNVNVSLSASELALLVVALDAYGLPCEELAEKLDAAHNAASRLDVERKLRDRVRAMEAAERP